MPTSARNVTELHWNEQGEGGDRPPDATPEAEIIASPHLSAKYPSEVRHVLFSARPLAAASRMAAMWSAYGQKNRDAWLPAALTLAATVLSPDEQRLVGLGQAGAPKLCDKWPVTSERADLSQVLWASQQVLLSGRLVVLYEAWHKVRQIPSDVAKLSPLKRALYRTMRAAISLCKLSKHPSPCCAHLPPADTLIAMLRDANFSWHPYLVGGFLDAHQLFPMLGSAPLFFPGGMEGKYRFMEDEEVGLLRRHQHIPLEAVLAALHYVVKGAATSGGGNSLGWLRLWVEERADEDKIELAGFAFGVLSADGVLPPKHVNAFLNELLPHHRTKRNGSSKGGEAQHFRRFLFVRGVAWGWLYSAQQDGNHTLFDTVEHEMAMALLSVMVQRHKPLTPIPDTPKVGRAAFATLAHRYTDNVYARRLPHDSILWLMASSLFWFDDALGEPERHVARDVAVHLLTKFLRSAKAVETFASGGLTYLGALAFLQTHLPDNSRKAYEIALLDTSSGLKAVVNSATAYLRCLAEPDPSPLAFKERLYFKFAETMRLFSPRVRKWAGGYAATPHFRRLCEIAALLGWKSVVSDYCPANIPSGTRRLDLLQRSIAPIASPNEQTTGARTDG